MPRLPRRTFQVTVPVGSIVILLAILKATGAINVSWWVVFAPAIVVYGIIAAVMLLIAAIGVVILGSYFLAYLTRLFK